MGALAAAGQDTGATIAGIIGLVGLFVAYWFPTGTAWARHVPNKGSVFVVNLLAGWTVIGWIIALAMACRSPYQPGGTVSITHRGHGVSR